MKTCKITGALLVLSLVVACGKSASEPLKAEPLVDAQADAPLDASADAVSDAPGDGQPTDGPADGPAGTCPDNVRPPKLVRLPGKTGFEYCMDQREVTAREYEEFIIAKNGDTSGQAAECVGNKHWVGPLATPDAWERAPWECDPRGYDPANYPNRAVGCVDHCDARAYCAWAGKRLCGKLGGGPGSMETMADPAQSEWVNACTQGGTTKYPWGDVYLPGRCVDKTALSQKGVQARDIASVDGSKCHGSSLGFADVYDLVGSVQEWGAECGDGGKACALHGAGSMISPSGPDMSCDTMSLPSHTTHFELGFRCCADAIPGN